MNGFLIIILAILIGSYLLDLLVETLNLRHAEMELPEEFRGIYDSERYRRSQSYLRENTRFGILEQSVITPIVIAFILWGGFNQVDAFARGFGWSPIPTGLIFAGVLLFGYHLFTIPFSIYETFVIEEKYGFNRTTARTFLLDILKGWLLAAVLGGIMLSAVLWFFHKAGDWAWLYCWLAFLGFQAFLLFVAPVTILPLFNKFSPLKDEELKDAIEQYARSQDFKMKGVFSMDGSRRSIKSNAFFTGFGKFRRIVLFDTLIERLSVPELVSILAHEMGHYKKKHVAKSFAVSAANAALMFLILSLFINNRQLFDAFGMERLSIYASLVFFGFLYAPIETLLSIGGNVLSRKHEFEADLFSARTYQRPESLVQALKKLTVDHLSNLRPHPLKVFIAYSHPPVLRRIRALRNL